MKHREQTTSFQYNEFPYSASMVPFLLKSRYLRIDLGNLFEHVCSILKSEVGVLRNTINFSIVNLCSPYSNFSHGRNSPPPELLFVPGSHLLITFALTQIQTYPAGVILDSNINVSRRANRILVWSYGKGQFLTISLNSEQCARYGIFRIGPDDLQYLYNMLGCMTKSFVRRHSSYYTYAPIDYSPIYNRNGRLPIVRLHNRLFEKPFKNLVKTEIYPMWAFNRHVWEMAPNLISDKMMTPEVALYYFIYLTHLPKISRIQGDRWMQQFDPNNENSIAHHLSRSLLNLASYAATGVDSLSVQDLIAPCVLESLVLTGKTKINVDTQGALIIELTNKAKSFIHLLRDTGEEISKLLTPPDKVARLILFENQAFLEKLMNFIKLGEGYDSL